MMCSNIKIDGLSSRAGPGVGKETAEEEQEEGDFKRHISVAASGEEE